MKIPAMPERESDEGKSPGDLMRAAPTMESAGGRYVVLGTLGRGAMGTVYEAFDRTLDRTVAVKVLRGEYSPRHTERLMREARALAKVSHPNVVQVYEVGQMSGRAFVAMERLDGRTLDAWMKREPRPDWRATVEVFIGLADGLTAAHAAGLVHRDFKPSNAFVDAQGRPRLLDFGLVRLATDEADYGEDQRGSLPTEEGLEREVESSSRALTHTGAVLGTPAYMPPEQMHGQRADALSDQFSFCVSLHEALYGQRPFDGTSMAALSMSIEAGTIRPPPAASKVPAALRKVLVRGLSASPEQRWPSMDALSTELAAVARPRGRRSWTAGVLVVLASSVAGLLAQRYTETIQRCRGASELLAGVWDERTRADVEDALLRTERSYAASTWARVGPRLDDYATAWTETHTEACEATSIRHAQSEDVMDLRMGCLQERKAALSATVGVLVRADAEIVQNAVDLMDRLPPVGDCSEVERLVRRRQRVTPPPPASAARVAELREELAGVRALEAAGVYDQALQEVSTILEASEPLGYAPLTAEALLWSGRLHEHRYDYERQEHDFLRSYALAAEHGLDEVVIDAATNLVTVVGFVGERHDEALLWAKVAEPLARRSGDAIREATLWMALGTLRIRLGEYARAQRDVEHAGELFERALGPDHPSVASSVMMVGVTQSIQGHYDDALRSSRRARRIYEAALGAGHPKLAKIIANIASTLAIQGQFEEAKRLHQEALEIQRRALGDDHPVVAEGLNGLGNVAMSQRAYEEAAGYYRSAIEIWERALGSDDPSIAPSLSNLGNALSALGQYDEAESEIRRALRILEHSVGRAHPSVAQFQENLADVLHRRGDGRQALRMYRQALELREELVGDEHPDLAHALLGLAEVELAQGDHAAAAAHAERALAVREAGAVTPEWIATAQFMLARALWPEPHARDRAKALAERAREAFADVGVAGENADRLREVERWLEERSPPSDDRSR